jgi:hypothetical protein
MGPYTLEALQAELDQLTAKVEAARSSDRISGTEQAVLAFRVQMLQAMLKQQSEPDQRSSRH